VCSRYKDLEEYMMGIECEAQFLVDGELSDKLARNGSTQCMQACLDFSTYEALHFILNSHHVFFKLFVPRTHWYCVMWSNIVYQNACTLQDECTFSSSFALFLSNSL
jgi:hypothetical protein